MIEMNYLRPEEELWPEANAKLPTGEATAPPTPRAIPIPPKVNTYFQNRS